MYVNIMLSIIIVRVLYFSAHRYEHGKFWPHLRESDYDYNGAGRGIGYNCNVPINETGMGNEEYLAVWTQLLLPLAYQVCYAVYS